MGNTDFKIFCRDIAIGLVIIITIVFLSNLSGIFDFHEVSSRPEQMWRTLIQKKSANTDEIIFSGNSHTYFLNPIIIDSITKKKSQSFGYSGAIIKPLSWFLFNSLDYLNPKLVVLETHSFLNSFRSSSIDLIRYKRWENDYPRFNESLINLNYISWSQKILLESYSLFDTNKFEIPYLITGPAIKNHFVFETLPSNIFNALFPSKNNVALQGFKESHHLPISDSILQQYNREKAPLLLPPIGLKEPLIVESIIAKCKARGIEVLIYESPMYYKSVKSSYKRKKQLDSFCERLNIPYLDLNLDVSLTRTPHYFQNTTSINQHLTIDGANAVSKTIANYIVEQKLLSIRKKN